ncbi:MAG: tetratricopeptide repeat protein [Planctomycetota bacterium]
MFDQGTLRRSTQTRTVAALLTMATALLLPCVLMPNAMAQQEPQDAQSKPTKIAPDQLLQPLVEKSDELPPAAQSKLVNAIYNATKSAKHAKDYTALIEQCDQTIKAKINQKNRSYVTSIKGWAFNRRGESRLDVARQFKSIGSVQQFKKAFAQSMQDFDMGLISDPKRHRSWNARGVAFMVNENWNAATKDFTEATKLKPDYVAGWFNRAEANYHAERFEQAIKDYETVIRFDSDDAEALTGRAHSLLAIDKFETAMKDYDAVVVLLNDQPMPRVNRGDAWRSAGKWVQALKDYQTAVQLKPETSDSQQVLVARQRLAWLLATCPDSKIADGTQALELIQNVIQNDGETSARLETLAAAQAATGAFDSAKTSQTNAIRLVNSEEISDESPSKVRLTLYEQNQPFRLSPDEEKDSTSGSDKPLNDADRSKNQD